MFFRILDLVVVTPLVGMDRFANWVDGLGYRCVVAITAGSWFDRLVARPLIGRGIERLVNSRLVEFAATVMICIISCCVAPAMIWTFQVVVPGHSPLTEEGFLKTGWLVPVGIVALFQVVVVEGFRRGLEYRYHLVVAVVRN